MQKAYVSKHTLLPVAPYTASSVKANGAATEPLYVGSRERLAIPKILAGLLEGLSHGSRAASVEHVVVAFECEEQVSQELLERVSLARCQARK
jgi:hypothetical protein